MQVAGCVTSKICNLLCACIRHPPRPSPSYNIHVRRLTIFLVIGASPRWFDFLVTPALCRPFSPCSAVVCLVCIASLCCALLCLASPCCASLRLAVPRFALLLPCLCFTLVHLAVPCCALLCLASPSLCLASPLLCLALPCGALVCLASSCCLSSPRGALLRLAVPCLRPSALFTCDRLTT